MKEHAPDFNTRDAAPPCQCSAWVRSDLSDTSTHHHDCEKRVSLWECDNCGERAIDGRGKSWSSGRAGQRLHACTHLPARLSPCTAFRVRLTPAEQALAGLVVGVRRWAAEGDGVPDLAWEFYAEACRVLELPDAITHEANV